MTVNIKHGKKIHSKAFTNHLPAKRIMFGIIKIGFVSNPSIFSEMQREWDLAKATSKMNLIEVKKQRDRYNEALLKQKVENMLAACPDFKKYDIRLGCLSLEDM